jgi:hypothetical protein
MQVVRSLGPWDQPPRPTETELAAHARASLSQFATNIEPEYHFESLDGKKTYRVDIKAELKNGEYALVEVKAFRDNLTPYIDAIIQAASYADAIRYPVFIGPVTGSRETLAAGRLDNALGALHLVAGRLNVGFLYLTQWGTAGLLLRGQRLVDAGGLSGQFATHWGYVERLGSKQVRS